MQLLPAPAAGTRGLRLLPAEAAAADTGEFVLRKVCSKSLMHLLFFCHKLERQRRLRRRPASNRAVTRSLRLLPAEAAAADTDEFVLPTAAAPVKLLILHYMYLDYFTQFDNSAFKLQIQSLAVGPTKPAAADAVSAGSR